MPDKKKTSGKICRPNVAKELAAQFGMSERAVRYAAVFSESVDAIAGLLGVGHQAILAALGPSKLTRPQINESVGVLGTALAAGVTFDTPADAIRYAEQQLRPTVKAPAATDVAVVSPADALENAASRIVDHLPDTELRALLSDLDAAKLPKLAGAIRGILIIGGATSVR